MLLSPFWGACFRIVKASEILVPDPATEYCVQRYNRKRYAHILIQARMHANSDKEMGICMRILNSDEIRFTSMNIVFKQIKGTVHRC